MSFPDTWQIIRHYNMFLLSGPIICCISAGFWWRTIRDWRCLGWNRDVGRLLMFAVVTLLIGSVHLLGIYASVANAIQFRVEPSRIREIVVEKIREEGDAPTGPAKTITDARLILDGFKRLETATSRSRNHEHFLDGYRIMLRVDGRTKQANIVRLQEWNEVRYGVPGGGADRSHQFNRPVLDFGGFIPKQRREEGKRGLGTGAPQFQ